MRNRLGAGRNPSGREAKMKDKDNEKGNLRGRVIAVIVTVGCCQLGASALLTGEFYVHGTSNRMMINLEGFGAYVAGIVFLGFGLYVGASLFRR